MGVRAIKNHCKSIKHLKKIGNRRALKITSSTKSTHSNASELKSNSPIGNLSSQNKTGGTSSDMNIAEISKIRLLLEVLAIVKFQKHQ